MSTQHFLGNNHGSYSSHLYAKTLLINNAPTFAHIPLYGELLVEIFFYHVVLLLLVYKSVVTLTKDLVLNELRIALRDEKTSFFQQKLVLQNKFIPKYF